MTAHGELTRIGTYTLYRLQASAVNGNGYGDTDITESPDEPKSTFY